MDTAIHENEINAVSYGGGQIFVYKPMVDFLASEGCDMIQGFYFAKPMPSEDYEKRMAQSPVKLEQFSV